MTDGLFIIPT